MSPVSGTSRADVVIATRQSALAMWQARHIEERLKSFYPRLRVSIFGMTTQGDRMLDQPLDQAGGKGLFVKELEDALAAGTADIAVHSMKDVPMELAPGFAIAAVSEREDPRDALVCNGCLSLAQLPPGSRVGTSSLRRESQVRARFPRLSIEPVRGNVATRLKKLDEGRYAALILAAAGLKRLGLDDRIAAILTPEESLPAPGQGALAIECLSAHTDLLELLSALNDETTAACVNAERAMSRALAGNCQLPLGAYAEAQGYGMRLRGFVADRDGSRIARAEVTGTMAEPDALGRDLADRLKALGADEILAALKTN